MENYNEKNKRGVKNHRICTYKWINEGVEKKGTVQIFHGMAEYILRYEGFIEFLTKNGYIVIGHDHLAHGNSTEDPSKIGIIEDEDYMEGTINVCKLVREHYKADFELGSSYLFSHSMGSMVAHRYIELYPTDYDKVILCGTDISSLKYKLGSVVFKRLMKKHGPISYPALLDSLTMKPFNKRFKNDHPMFGWLSANKENYSKYGTDKLCGGKFPTNYYYSLAKMLIATGEDENLKLIDKSIKILLLSGKDDPVTNYSKSTIKLHRRFKKYNINVMSEIYYNARHEILNEKNEIKELVHQDILAFLNA